ncbi:dUTP diphosphatase [Planococcus sp. 1R117A]|uniref:dUTP diphosphatase n=1 Tax=Planococcus sp. 1R117A TaxID=3447020 RepID=UPI003EDBFF46
MELQELFKMQEELDRFIQTNQGISEDVFRKKGLALLVELAELANETRCFKFWSTKGPSDRAVILEEYVDSIHFLLSVGIEKELTHLATWPKPISEEDLTEMFLGTQSAIHKFIEDYSMENYQEIWSWYGAIAVELGFTYEEVLKAYIAKNQTNYDRQNEGY